MELSSSFLWPPWWPPQWPTAPAVPGTLSASSSHCASGGSRGSLTVRLGEAEGLMSPASRPLLSGYRDRYCSVLPVLEVVCAIIFIYLFFPADTVVNDLWFEAYSAAATCRLFYRIDADRPLAIWGRFFFSSFFSNTAPPCGF